MVEAVTVTGLDEVKLMLNDLPRNTFDAAKFAIGKATNKTHEKVSSFSGGLNSRSGRLKRSLITELTGEKLSTLSGQVYTKSKYALIHEKGGTVKAIDKYLGVPGGPYLNIPLSANKTAAGVMRMSARSVFDAGGYIVKSKAGKYIVMSGSNQPMFVLTKQVTIPARLGMEKAAIEQVPLLLSTLDYLMLEGL